MPSRRQAASFISSRLCSLSSGPHDTTLVVRNSDNEGGGDAPVSVLPERSDVRFGSTAVIQRGRRERPLLEVKQTKSGAKGTLPHEGRLSTLARIFTPRRE